MFASETTWAYFFVHPGFTGDWDLALATPLLPGLSVLYESIKSSWMSAHALWNPHWGLSWGFPFSCSYLSLHYICGLLVRSHQSFISNPRKVSPNSGGPSPSFIQIWKVKPFLSQPYAYWVWPPLRQSPKPLMTLSRVIGCHEQTPRRYHAKAEQGSCSSNRECVFIYYLLCSSNLGKDPVGNRP